MPQKESDELRESHSSVPLASVNFPFGFEINNLLTYHNVPNDVVTEFEQNDQCHPGKQLKGIGTMPKVKIMLAKRQEENEEIDGSRPGRPYARLVPSRVLWVNSTQYKSHDPCLPLDPLWWPDQQRLWMPVPPQVNTDVPITEKDVRYLERLVRTLLRAVNVLVYNNECLDQLLENNTPSDYHAQCGFSKSIYRVYDHVVDDVLKLSVELLTSIVNLRRDAVLLHTRIPPFVSAKLRNAPFASNLELFTSDHIFDAHELIADNLIRYPFASASGSYA